MFEDDVDVLGASPAPSVGGASQFSLFDSTQGSEAAAEDAIMSDDIARLRRALWNEKASPEILAFEEEAVEDLKELVDHQVREICFFFVSCPCCVGRVRGMQGSARAR